jgi:antitoxin MazE
MGTTTKISKWGNSFGIRIPVSVLRETGLEMDMQVHLDTEDRRRIIISRIDAPRKGTLAYLFKDYSGEPFETELIDLGGPTGEEKW